MKHFTYTENGSSFPGEDEDEDDGETEKTPTTDDELPTMTISTNLDLNSTTMPGELTAHVNLNVTKVNGLSDSGRSGLEF